MSADELPQGIDLLLLPFDLRLLFFDGVDEEHGQTGLHVLGLALVVARHQKRIDLGTL